MFRAPLDFDIGKMETMMHGFKNHVIISVPIAPTLFGTNFQFKRKFDFVVGSGFRRCFHIFDTDGQ
jgi:hypothetical protein